MTWYGLLGSSFTGGFDRSWELGYCENADFEYVGGQWLAGE